MCFISVCPILECGVKQLNFEISMLQGHQYTMRLFSILIKQPGVKKEKSAVDIWRVHLSPFSYFKSYKDAKQRF